MTDHPAAAPEDEFRLAQAERALDYQMASVDAAQGRAAIVLGAIGLTGSVLLPGAVDRVDVGVHAWLFGIGLYALLVAGGVTGFAVWPRRYGTTVDLPDLESAPEMTRQLTATINTKLSPRNAHTQQRVWCAVKSGLVAFAIHALCWGRSSRHGGITVSDTGNTTPAPQLAPDPAPVVNPAPVAAEAYPDTSIQGFVGSGSVAESNIHYRSLPDDEG